MQMCAAPRGQRWAHYYYKRICCRIELSFLTLQSQHMHRNDTYAQKITVQCPITPPSVECVCVFKCTHFTNQLRLNERWFRTAADARPLAFETALKCVVPTQRFKQKMVRAPVLLTRMRIVLVCVSVANYAHMPIPIRLLVSVVTKQCCHCCRPKRPQHFWAS